MTATLRHRISDGTLDRRKVEVAAALGCEAAIAAGVEPAVLDNHYRTRIEQVTANLTQRQCIVFGFECAMRALRVWERKFPSDLRPRHAMEAVRSWLAEKETRAEFTALCQAAEHSRIDVDYPELTEDVDPALCAAMEATSACSHAALAVQSIRDHEGHEELCRVTAWIARFGVKSASDRGAETAWQTGLLVAMLLQ